MMSMGVVDQVGDTTNIPVRRSTLVYSPMVQAYSGLD